MSTASADSKDRARRRNRAAKELALAGLVLCLLAYTWMYSKVSVPNERTRIFLALAIVDDGTLSIDGPVHRFGRPADVAEHGGRYYTDKAPGSSLLGALVYGAARLGTAPEDWTIEELVSLMRTWLMLPIGVLGFILLRIALRRRGSGEPTVDIVSLGWILGSAAFHYSTAFYGHQIAAVALLASLELLEGPRAEGRGGAGASLRAAAAGVAAGIAGLVEYQSAVPCALLAAFAIAGSPRRPGRWLPFLAGAAPFAAGLLAYNTAAFGGPWELPYHHLVTKAMQVQHNFGIGGVTWPKGPAVFGSLLSLHRGLLVTAPLFALLPFGLWLAWKRGERPLALLVGLSALYYLLFVFSAEVWHGGWGFGLRLFAPVMAWAAIPVAYAVERLLPSVVGGGIVRGLAVFGLIYNQLVHAVFPEPSDSAANPILDLVAPCLGRGLLSPNLASDLTGSPGLWTAAPLALLVAGTAAFLIARGTGRHADKLDRLVSSGFSLAVLVPYVAAIALSGPAWTSKQTQKFVGWMERLERAEYPADRPPS